jgi:hypothetical protein
MVPSPVKPKICPVNVDGVSSFNVPVELMNVTDPEAALTKRGLRSAPQTCEYRPKRPRFAQSGSVAFIPKRRAEQ